MATIQKYFRLISYQCRIAVKLLLMFRINAVGLAFAASLWSLLVLTSIFFTTRNITTVFGYTPGELLAIGAIQVIFLGIFHATVSKNMEQLPDLMNKGMLDSILLKPVDDQYQVSFAQVFPAATIRILIGVVSLTYLVLKGTILIPSILNVFLFAGLLMVSELLVYSIWFMVTTTLIWFPTMENIVELMYMVNTVSRYPYEFYREIAFTVALFTFPLSIALTTPLKVLTGKVTIAEVGTLLATTAIFLFVSRKFWKWSLRHYTSASN